MTSKPVEYYYTLANPRRVPGIDGTPCVMYPDVSSENWCGPFGSVREAVEDARRVWRDKYGDFPDWGVYAAVAPLARLTPTVDVGNILQNLRKDAYDVGGWDARGFVACLDEITDEDREALHSGLQAILHEWLKERDLWPRFGKVQTSKFQYYPLWEGATL